MTLKDMVSKSGGIEIFTKNLSSELKKKVLFSHVPPSSCREMDFASRSVFWDSGCDCDCCRHMAMSAHRLHTGSSTGESRAPRDTSNNLN